MPRSRPRSRWLEALVAVALLAPLAASAPALGDVGPLPASRSFVVAAGEEITVPLTLHTATLVSLEADEEVLVRLAGDWRTAWRYNDFVTSFHFAGASPRTLEPVSCGWSVGFCQIYYDLLGGRAAVSGPFGSYVLPDREDPDRDPLPGMRTTSHALVRGEPVWRLFGVESSALTSANLTVSSAGDVTVTLRELPITYLDEHDRRGDVCASVRVKASVFAGACAPGETSFTTDGRLFGRFVHEAYGGYAAASLRGPGYVGEGEPRYDVVGGQPGRWTYDREVAAGGGFRSYALWFEVPG